MDWHETSILLSHGAYHNIKGQRLVVERRLHWAEIDDKTDYFLDTVKMILYVNKDGKFVELFKVNKE